MNKKGRSEAETIGGFIIFGLILFIFISAGVFSSIINAFSQAFTGGFGLLLGVLFILIIVISLLDKILGK